jgi:nucleotide-binding universal stress UspA family protein
MAVVILIVLVAVAGGLAVGHFMMRRAGRSGDERRQGGRILLPCMGSEISRRAVDAALRLAKAEGATIVPVLLVRVPRQLPLETPLVPDSRRGVELIEAIRASAAAAGVSVDPRVSRGRSYRDALRRLVHDEQFERTIVSSTSSHDLGRSLEDLQFLFERVPGEVMILRSDPADRSRISATGPDRRDKAQEVAERTSELRRELRAGRVASTRPA